MNDPEHRPDPAALLQAFVASNRSERAFAALVNSLSGLVYSSALRRTGNSQLAEEIAQNVFAIMARKANTLCRHPSLVAWALETTRLQSANAIRSERLRRRKIAALTEESKAEQTIVHAMEPTDTPWRDAVPVLDDALDRLPTKDRRVILQRFYEGKKFREIAHENGQTEAACKMRVKRALDKLSKFLTARGATLSTTAIATVLGTELARSAPAPVAASMSSTALAASPSIPITTIIANTLQTMSNTKTAAATGAAVLALAAIPISSQYAEGSRMREQLETLGNTVGVTETVGRNELFALPRPRGRATRADLRTPADMLEWVDQPADPRELLKSMTRGDTQLDHLEWMLTWARIGQMAEEEQYELIDELGKLASSPESRAFLRERLMGEYGLDLSPSQQLDRLLEIGAIEANEWGIMTSWARRTPADALAWYREKRASGEIFGDGLESDLQKRVLHELLRVIGSSMPDAAVDLYLTTPKNELNNDQFWEIAEAVGFAMATTGNDGPATKLITGLDESQRASVFRSAATQGGRYENFALGMDFVYRHETDPESRRGILDSTFQRLISADQIAGAMDWVTSNMESAEAHDVITRAELAPGMRGVGPGISEWVDSQPPGLARDHGYAGRAERLAGSGDFARAMEEAANIQDPSLAASVREMVGRQLSESDGEPTSPDPASLQAPSPETEAIQRKILEMLYEE